MKTCLSRAFLMLLPGVSFATTFAADKPTVRVVLDPRVELCCVVFRLAGNPEYNKGRIEAYAHDVDAHFGAHREHGVVKLAGQLRQTRGVSFDACMSLAVHLDDVEHVALRVPWEPRPADLDSRWVAAEAREFLSELRQFAADTRFQDFWTAHRALYETAAQRMQELLDRQAHLEWFPEYFGPRTEASFIVAVALLNGPNNYGARCLLPDGREELHCILGAWTQDEQGLPTFGTGVLETVIHEFCHSHTNPIVDRHAAELESAGQRLFAGVSDAMERQAYGQWKTMLYESLVRACTIRYLRRHQGLVAAWWRTKEDEGRQFRWTGDLASLLAEYEQQRDKYPTLEAFAPRIVTFFNDQAERAESMPKPKSPAAPRVVSVTPADGTTGVDPHLAEIRVVFDRRMKDQAWSLVGGGPELPEVIGAPAYDAARTTWTVPVRLQPEHSYRFLLNSDRFRAFQSEDGVSLESVTVRFQTGK